VYEGYTFFNKIIIIHKKINKKIGAFLGPEGCLI